MASLVVDIVNGDIAWLHEQVLKVASRLSDEQLAWRFNLHTPPISFHLCQVQPQFDKLST